MTKAVEQIAVEEITVERDSKDKFIEELLEDARSGFSPKNKYIQMPSGETNTSSEIPIVPYPALDLKHEILRDLADTPGYPRNNQ